MIVICKCCDAKSFGEGKGSQCVLCLDCGGDFCFACMHDGCEGDCGCDNCRISDAYEDAGVTEWDFVGDSVRRDEVRKW